MKSSTFLALLGSLSVCVAGLHQGNPRHDLRTRSPGEQGMDVDTAGSSDQAPCDNDKQDTAASSGQVPCDDDKQDAAASSGQVPCDDDKQDKKGWNAQTDLKAGKYFGAYWPTYHDGILPSDKLNVSLYTDLYFFVATTQQNFSIGLGGLDPANWDRLANAFVDECNGAGVRPLLSIGGWTGGLYFSNLVATAENRTQFATSLANFTQKYGFKGIDIDWEYPSSQGIGCNAVSGNDTDNFGLFLTELRSMLPDHQLSAAVNIGGIKTGDSAVLATNLTAMAAALDHVNVMAYDVYGSFTKTSGPLGPLYSTCNGPDGKGLSISDSVSIFTNAGFATHQIVMGVPTYGRSFTTLNATLTPKTVGNETTYLYQPFDPKTKPGGKTDDPAGKDVCGNVTGPGGVWLVEELVERGFLSSDLLAGGNGFTRYFDDCSGTPFIFNNQTGLLVSYDDTQSSVSKARFAKDHGLGGLFVFDTYGGLPATMQQARAALQ